MRAIQALYEDGRVFFPFHDPQYEGPVAVLVIFPDEPGEETSDEEDPPPEPPPRRELGALKSVPKIPWPGDCLRRKNPI